MSEESRVLDADQPQKTSYCIPLWLRNLQIEQSIARIKTRIEPGKPRPEPMAIVCFGPSLNDTWEEIRKFRYVMTCSGAHKFLVDRGIIPTHHVDVDPRPHKAKLLGVPQKGTEYLILSCCHKDMFDLLEGFDVKLWHAFETDEEAIRVLPHGEWAITGGCSAGLRCLVVARFLGFSDLHVFGMDGNQGLSGKHAGEHPNQAKQSFDAEYPKGSGKIWQTTPAFLEAARGTFHELDRLPDVKVKFYGEGLVQEMAKNYVRTEQKEKVTIAAAKEQLISDEMRELNAKLHAEKLAYGVGGAKHVDTVLKLAETLGQHPSVLDYGCGKGMLAKALPWPIWEFDPAVPNKDESPRPADLVVCTDVLEHVEPDRLVFVLGDLKRCVKNVGYFVIHTGPAAKTYADGRNTHLIQRDEQWWGKMLKQFFVVGKIIKKGPELHVVVGAKEKSKKAKIMGRTVKA